MATRTIDVTFTQTVVQHRTISYDPDEETQDEAIESMQERLSDEVIEADGHWSVETIKPR